MEKTILIIDDDDMLRNTLARGLRAEKFNILTANGAGRAAEILTKVSVDAIVLDRMMGDIDGLSFLKNIRATGDRTPVIMLTAMSGPDNTIDGLAGGANDYMQKPFQLRELVLRLNNITKNSAVTAQDLPNGLIFNDGEFFITEDDKKKLLNLSGEEKSLLTRLISPIGNTVMAQPMVAKRLRCKLNDVLLSIDIITIRGSGYKLIHKSPQI